MVALMNDARLLRRLFWPLQRFRPVLKVGKTVLLTRHADVCEVLARDDDFPVPEGSRATIERLMGPFMLRMDRSPEYVRERGIVGRAVHADDLERVRAAAHHSAGEMVRAAEPGGRVDVVRDVAEPVTAHLVASYLGLPGPGPVTLLRWMRTIFHEAFLNFGKDADVQATGNRSASELRDYADELVNLRASQLAGGQSAPDDLLTRLLRMQSDPDTRLEDQDVRRNVSGLAVAGVEVVRAVSHVLDELLRRPDALASACGAAAADDQPAMAAYTFEALRFHPTNPLLPRQAGRATRLRTGVSDPPELAAGASVLLAVLPAMFDPSVFEDPGRFRIDRPPSAYLHFGHGLHECFAKQVNLVFIPEVVAAVLRLNGLRRAPGREGQLAYDGPFPRRLVVEFDARSGT